MPCCVKRLLLVAAAICSTKPSMPLPRVPKFTAGLADVPGHTRAPATLAELDALVQQMSFAVVSEPLAPALQGKRVVRGQYGLASRRMLPPTLSSDTRRSPNFTRMLFQFFTSQFPDKVASSCTVAFHRAAPLHIHNSNIGLSYAAAIGCSSGGNLWTANPYSDHGAVLRTSEALCEFDSLLLHTTLPFSGPRYYISFYCHRAAARASDVVRSQLVELNVPLPSRAECEAMQEAAKQKSALRQRRADGHRQWQAYLSTLPAQEKVTMVESQQRKGGSWICLQCHVFGPFLPLGGRPRFFCSRMCENKVRRSIVRNTKEQRTRHCKRCGRAFLRAYATGAPHQSCPRCR